MYWSILYLFNAAGQTESTIYTMASVTILVIRSMQPLKPSSSHHSLSFPICNGIDASEDIG